jgi:hypothetical protein
MGITKCEVTVEELLAEAKGVRTSLIRHIELPSHHGQRSRGAVFDSLLAKPEELWKIRHRFIGYTCHIELNMARIYNRCGSNQQRRERQQAQVFTESSGPMTFEELAAGARSVFGDRWIRPLARLLDCSPALIRLCRRGERDLSAEAAAKVRDFVDLGPAGTIVREAMKAALPHARPVVTHRAAKRALAELAKAGLLTSSAQRPPVGRGRIVGPFTCSSPADDLRQTKRRHQAVFEEKS